MSAALQTIRLGRRESLRRTLRLCRVQLELSLKGTLREPQAVFFLLLFPIMLFVIFGSVFPWTIDDGMGNDTGVKLSHYLAAGIIGSSLFGTAFMNLAIGIVGQREEGWLKRLGGSPVPKAAFFAGQIGSAMLLTLAQVVAMLVIGVAGFGLDLPSGTQWLTLFWVLVLGVTAGCALGIAVTRVIPSVRAAPPIVNFPFIGLQFISGVFLNFDILPTWLQWLANIFPLRWLCLGLRSVFLPDEFQTAEVGGSWQLEWVAIVLLIWFVVALAVALRTFRWDQSG